VTSLTLDEIPHDSTVFLDANIFVYYSTGTSVSCRTLLDRCAMEAVHGLTSLAVLLEVAHRLMIIEAQQKGLIRGGNPAKKLAESPEIVKQLDLYEEQVLKIPKMGIEVEEATIADFSRSLVWRKRTGLLTLDSLILAVMERRQVRNLASADKDFQQADGVQLFSPADIQMD